MESKSSTVKFDNSTVWATKKAKSDLRFLFLFPKGEREESVDLILGIL